ncbi:hypothetical protein N9J26_01350 [bacterium]|nr:hypothetical protein [bacterium]
MATIIYGVSGEGSGHSSRAKVVAAHLTKQGHRVKILSYDKGLANLKDEFDVKEVVGLSIISRDNTVSMVRTVKTNLSKFSAALACVRSLKALFKEIQPDLVITDFEPTSAYLAKKYNLPLISIDNQHRMRYVDCDTPPGLSQDALITRAIIKAMVPRPSVALVTSFHSGTPKNKHTFIFPPMIRPSIRALSTCTDGAVLVYVTSHFDTLLTTLSDIDQPFIVYGSDKVGQQGNLSFKAHSQEGFLSDLSRAKAVVATAGFTLISESLYLGKPYLAYPMKGQFEQQLNAYMLEKKGYGARGLTPNKPTIEQFLANLDEYRQALEHYPRDTDDGILAKLDALIGEKDLLVNA